MKDGDKANLCYIDLDDRVAEDVVWPSGCNKAKTRWPWSRRGSKKEAGANGISEFP